MAVQSLSPWIADLVQEEINAVLTWQTNKNDGIKVEADEALRFTTDGSNFRSIVSQTEPGRSEVQLIEVLGSPGPTGVKAVVSDGHTRIKAWLVSSVVDILEAELDGDLGPETTNDVFRLNRFVVVSTAIGPADEKVQLNIEDIEYLYLRRRNIGQPAPIEQDENIRPLITDRIATLLERTLEIEIKTEGGADDLQSQASQSEPVSVAVRQSSPIIVPVSPPPRSPPSAHKRRKPQHNLEDDGFELRTGVNLQGPVKAQRRDDDTLLRLLRKQKPRAEVVAETPARPHDRSRDIRGHGLFSGAAIVRAQSVTDSPEHMDIDISPQRSENPQDDDERAQDLPSSPPKPTTPRSTHQLQLSRPGPSKPSSSRISPERFSNPRISQGADDLRVDKSPSQSKSVRSTPNKPRIPYGRRKIPANQRALLDKETSWLPSLPGCCFPKPNVPIELLTKWNAARIPSHDSTTALGRKSASPSLVPRSRRTSQHEAVSAQEDDGAQQDDESSDSPSDSSEHPDHMVSSSQWPSSPTYAPLQPRPDLPPDSSIGNVIRGTPEQLQVEAPRALKVSRPVRKGTVQPQTVYRHPLPKRPSGPVPEGTGAMLDLQRHETMHAKMQHPQRSQNSPGMQQPSWTQASPPIQQSSRPAYASSLATSRQTSQRPPSSTSPHRTTQSGSFHTAPQPNSHGSIGRKDAQRPTPSISSFALPGLRLTGPSSARNIESPARHSQQSPAGSNGGSQQPTNQPPPRSSQTTHQAPLDPREYIQNSRSEWRAKYRKQEERLRAESIHAAGSETMREFVSSYIDIRPGGAFASPTIAAQPQRRPVDVLAWKI